MAGEAIVEAQTVFFVPGWDEWAVEFRRQAKALESVVAASEKCWVSVGQRQSAASIVVTIEREKATSVRPGWKAERRDGQHRLERFWEESDPSVEEVIEEIRATLSAPESAGF